MVSDDAPKPAAPTTRLSQLQRGRGAGFRAAIASGREAHDDVLQCVTTDPRVDSQGESRERYYAELIVAQLAKDEARTFSTPGSVPNQEEVEEVELELEQATNCWPTVALRNYLSQDRPGMQLEVKEACREM